MNENIGYFHPQLPEDDSKKKKGKGLISPKQVVEGAQQKAQKMSESKTKSNGLIQKEGDNRLLTNDGREIFNENK